VFPLKDDIPTDRLPIVTIALIVANALVYFLFQKGGILHGPSNANVIQYGAIPYEVTHPGQECGVVSADRLACGRGDAPGPSTWATVFTAMFMHGSIVHLGGNMLFLWIFGNNVEDAMGRVKFLVFYLLGGLAALALQTAVEPNAVVPTVGASGAIAAVLGGYIVLYPRARVATVVVLVFFFTILLLPAWIFLGVWIVQQILFGYFDLTDPTGGGGGVAYFAHIGGFVLGLLLVKAFADARRVKRPPTARPAYR
jgi:membrane associated rhomboid family serine protease